MQLAVVEQDHGPQHAVEVLARDRAEQAHCLHLSGLPWTDTARETGYASGRVAALAVTAWLERVAVEQGPEHRRQALQLELDRLDALQAAFWPAALERDRHAADVVLKVIARRSKILGFEKSDESLLPAPRTVLVGGTTEEYVGTL
ncbi:hypothetical protein [uncultured Jatrophihabitans sp.]|uniref:hypothetical protein n=1 Tax=uncultured Jatrophihabitans sp. TaxID=1610747 RepID=UPI0035C9F6D0